MTNNTNKEGRLEEQYLNPWQKAMKNCEDAKVLIGTYLNSDINDKIINVFISPIKISQEDVRNYYNLISTSNYDIRNFLGANDDQDKFKLWAILESEYFYLLSEVP